MKIRCIIVDDEQLARTLIQSFVEKIPFLEFSASFRSPLQAIQFINENQVDLMFLDIQMPDLTGIEMLKSVKNKPVTIFTTAYSEYALEGYELEIIDYLLKPFSFERFVQSVNKSAELIELRKQHNSSKQPEEQLSAPSTKDYIILKADHRTHKVYFDDIDYIEGLKEYVSFFTKTERIIVLESLKRLEETLPVHKFIRTHKILHRSHPKDHILRG